MTKRACAFVCRKRAARRPPAHTIAKRAPARPHILLFQPPFGCKRPLCQPPGAHLVAERVEALEDELEERPEVLGRRRGDEDVGVAEAERAGDREAERGGLRVCADRGCARGSCF